MECVFCKIVSGQIKARIVYETADTVAFLDAFPVSRGHTLVIPKKHFEKIQDMSSDDSRDLFDVVHKVISKVDSLSGATLLAAHNGKDAGQEVPHVHIHLVPRAKSDSAGPIHSMFTQRPNLSDSEFDGILEKLK